MQKFLLLFLFIQISLFSYSQSFDTIHIIAHDTTHLSTHGNYDKWAKFPSSNNSFRKVIMHYKLGCPTKGCSAWDYTTQVEALIHTGKIDTIIVKQPLFLINGEEKSKINLSTKQTYKLSFDTIKHRVDSIANKPLKALYFNDSLNRKGMATDSATFWKAGYYNYIFDSKGMVKDSVLVKTEQTLNLTFYSYKKAQEHIEHINLARFMTPYSGNLTSSWSRIWDYDVTDYLPIFNDSVEIRIYYGGWQDGFLVTLDFEFIKGAPVRKPLFVDVMWHSGPDGFLYGNKDHAITSFMQPYVKQFDKNTKGAMIRTIPSGHSFGGAENCSEFCNKNYYVWLNGTNRFTQAMWRNDCGMNPMYPQPGTWLYNRANWCPGAKALPHDHEITPYIHKTKTDTIRLTFDNYEYKGGAGFAPNYMFDAQLFSYGAITNKIDITMDEIIAPSTNPNHARYNPICTRPIIVIQNSGSDTLKSSEIIYGIEGAKQEHYSWTGKLAFLQKDTISLGHLDWDNAISDKFVCQLSMPNGKVDQYKSDNIMCSKALMPLCMPSSFVINLKTNKKSNENRYSIRDEVGKLIYKRDSLKQDSTYSDTISLNTGCYTFLLEDDGGDGLSFWANDSAGDGSLKFTDLYKKNKVLKMFTPDFGSQILFNFTVGYTLQSRESKLNADIIYYPTPSEEVVYIEKPLGEAAKIEITYKGNIVKTIETNTDELLITIDFKGMKKGGYLVNYITSTRNVHGKFVYRGK